MKITKAGTAFLLSIVCAPFFAKSQSIATSQFTVSQPRLVIPFGHQWGILHTLFSHENNMLITADEKMTIVSDVRSGKPLFYVQGTRPVISAKDNFIATIVDSVVMVWNTSDGLLANSLRFPSTVAHIAFHPVTDQLIIERLAGGTSDADRPQFYHAAIWDVKQKTIQYEFNNTGSDPCQVCKDKECPIVAAWFTNKGDSVRIVHPGSIKTYSLNDYQSGQNVCLTTNDNFGAATVRILNNHVIGLYGEPSTIFFNEYGQQVAHWTKKTSSDGINRQVTECISPDNNYLASYTSESIYLYNLKTQTLKYYNVDRGHVKKLSFNSVGKLILVEFLNEAPRIMTAEGFTIPKSFKTADYEGFPKYVYETKTQHEASDFTDGFHTGMANTHKPRRTLLGRVLNDGFGVPDPYSMVNGVMSIMVGGINIAFTNSGEIIDLATRRPISQIQSLIKMSGDVRLSPDKNLLLLHSGKMLSVYSIPACKVLVNLRPFYPDNVFSPDSRWLVQHVGGMSMVLVNLSNGLIDTISLNSRPPSTFNTVTFTPDSRQVIIGSGSAGSMIVDIATKTVHRTNNLNYYPSADGLKYGVMDHKTRMVYICSAKDSTRLYSCRLPDAKTIKSSNEPNNKSKGNKNKQKEKKKEEPAEEPEAIPVQISFGQNSDAFAIWSASYLQFVKDINKPGDTLLFEGEMANISTVTISANNNYLNIKPIAGNNIIINVRNRQAFQPIAQKEPDAFNMATMFRSALNGNLLNILHGRDMAQFSITGDSVLACEADAGYIYDCATGKMLHSFKAEGEIKYFSVANNMVISNHYGQLKFYTLTDMKEWLSMLPFTNGEMVYLLPNGIYSGSKSATRYLGYMQDAKSFSYKQFDYNNNRPDIVMRALGNTDARQLALYDTIMAMRRRREEYREVASSLTAKAPQVFITNEKDISGEVKQKVLTLRLGIKTFQKSPDKLAVYINGNPMGGAKGIRLSHKSYSIDTTVQVSLTQGKNNIEVSVFDASGAESFRQPLYVQYVPDSVIDRKLYFMGIGVSKYREEGHNLDYAQNDVRDILDSLRRRYGRQLVVDTFFNQQATLENLRKLQSKFSKTRPDDIVIIYYSGHGIMDGNMPKVYFGTYDVNFNNPSARGIPLEDLNGLLEYIPARNKVIFLDACNSGELNKEAGAFRMRKPGDTDPFDLVMEMFTDHYQGNGTNIVVAARGDESAKECEEIKLGVFTYTVLKGLAFMTADEDSNAVLTIGELQNYITRNVINNSAICKPRVVQRAGIRKENEYNDWAVLRNGSAAFGLRCTITETTRPRPLVNVVNDTRDTVNYYKDQVTTVFNRNSSIKDRVGAAGHIISGGVNSLLKTKDNATWLQEYRTKGRSSKNCWQTSKTL
jgi:hypothetical protein